MTLQEAIRRLEKMSIAGDRPDRAQFEYAVYLMWSMYESLCAAGIAPTPSIKFALADLAGVLSDEKEESA